MQDGELAMLLSTGPRTSMGSARAERVLLGDVTVLGVLVGCVWVELLSGT